MEYDRALFRVYERVLDDLNRSPSPFVSGSNVVTNSTNLIDVEQPPLPHQQQPSNVDASLPFFVWCFCFPGTHSTSISEWLYSFVPFRLVTTTNNETATTSSSSSAAALPSIQQDNSISSSIPANSVPSTTVENPFHQRALVRLHSWTAGRRRGSTPTEQQASDARRRGARQRRRQQPLPNDQQDDDGEEEVLIHSNANEASPLRPSPPNNHVTNSGTSRTISFGGHVNMNPFAPPPPNSFRNDNDDLQSSSSVYSQKLLQSIMSFTFGVAITHILILALLHSTYIRPDISSTVFQSTTIKDYYRTVHLPPKNHNGNNHQSSSSLTEAMDYEGKKQLQYAPPTNYTINNVNMTQQEIQFYLGKTCIEHALSTRPIQFFYNATHNETMSNSTIAHTTTTTTTTTINNNNNSSSEEIITHSTNTSNQRNDDAHQTNERNSSSSSVTGEWVALPLLRSDELLQINVVYGNSQSCLLTVNNKSDEQPAQCPTSTTHTVTEYPSSSTTTNNNNNSTNIDWSNSIQWEKPKYKFSTMEALLHVDNQFLWTHNISIVNLTVTERCLSSGADTIAANIFTKSAEILAQVYGMDAVIINQLMYGIRSVDGSYRDGFLLNTETEERWSWRKEFMEITDPRELGHNNLSWLINTKLFIVFLSFLSFFLVTSSTALIVRILTSSGVVLMFPIFTWLRLLGVHNADHRILGLSYPWIGRALSVVRLRSIYPDSHLIYAHLLRIVLYYIMYEASQAAWSVVLYGKSIPNGLPIWIYGFTMIWEYYSLIFVRSALGVYFFPRVTLLYFLGFHFYFYTVPYGYFDCALIPLFFLMVHAMIYSLLAFEVPAARRGAVSLECPREVYSRVSWPEWTASLPQEWTLFLPLNSRYVPLHDRDVESTTSRTAGREQS